jgi:hypothetical protein
MRTMVSIVALSTLALAACNKPAPAPEASEAAPAATEAAAPQAAATLTPGTYDVSTADGKPAGVTTVNADGTYSEDDAKGVRTAGIVRIVDGKTCFDASGKAPEECFADSPRAADGSFTVTDAKGVVLNVKMRAQ